MTEHYWTPQSNVSNETSTNKTFQRTISAQVHTHGNRHDMTSCSSTQTHLLSLVFDVYLISSVCVYHTLQDTLAYATALLNEKEQSGSSNGSDGSPANENADRSLRQVALSTAGSFLHDSCSDHSSQKKEKNGTKMEHLTSQRLSKGSLFPPTLLLAVDLKPLHSSLTPAVPDRKPTQHKTVRLVLAQA